MWLSVLIALIAIWYGYRRSKRETGIEVNHVTTFTVGFLFYWVLPPVAGFLAQTDAADEALSGWFDYLSQVPESHITAYNISIFICYIAFALGDWLGYKKPRSLPQKAFQNNLLRAEWYLTLILFLIVTFVARSLIFGDYSVGSSARGTVVAISLVLFGIAWKFFLFGNRKYMKMYFACTILLLMMGGRLYFISSVLAMLAYSSHKNPLPVKKILVWGPIAAIVMGAVGSIRVGVGASLFNVVLNVATESIYTSYSLVSYLRGNSIPLLRLPTYLASDFMNLIPSALIDKGKFVSLIDSNPFGIVSPLGAFHSWVSFILNFGVIGTSVFLFLFGYFMRRNEQMKTSYLMLTGFTAFTFFRDPFSVSLVKNMLEFSILIPACLDYLNQFIAYACQGTVHRFPRGPIPISNIHGLIDGSAADISVG